MFTCEMPTPQIDPNYSDLRSSDSGTSTTSWSVNASFTTPGLSHFDVKSVSHRMPHV